MNRIVAQANFSAGGPLSLQQWDEALPLHVAGGFDSRDVEQRLFPLSPDGWMTEVVAATAQEVKR